MTATIYTSNGAGKPISVRHLEDNVKHWTPYSTEDCSLVVCKQIAADCIASDKYAEVAIRHKKPENGRKFARVYVIRKAGA